MNVSKDVKYFDKSFEILLYATTAGIATKRPNAVAKRASAIPGATTAKFVFCAIAIDLKLFIIPQTVPNNPINGAVDPAVARKVKFLSTFSLSLLKTTVIDLIILSFKELISELSLSN